jgi:hypothetical protein
MRKAIAALLVAATLSAGCATVSNVKLKDTAMLGDATIAPSFYGRYRVLKGPSAARMAYLEVYASALGKPVFRLVDKDDTELLVASPLTCELRKSGADVTGSITCGKRRFLAGEYPFVHLGSGAHYPTNADDIQGLYSGKRIPFNDNWYSFEFNGSGGFQTDDYLLEKTNSD